LTSQIAYFPVFASKKRKPWFVAVSVLENQAAHRNYANDHDRIVSLELPETLGVPRDK